MKWTNYYDQMLLESQETRERGRELDRHYHFALQGAYDLVDRKSCGTCPFIQYALVTSSIRQTLGAQRREIESLFFVRNIEARPKLTSLIEVPKKKLQDAMGT